MFPGSNSNWSHPQNSFRSAQVSTTIQGPRSTSAVRKVGRKKMEDTDSNGQLPPVPPPRPQRQTTNTVSNYGYNSYSPYGGYQSNYNYGGYGSYNGGYSGGYNGMYGGYNNGYYNRPYATNYGNNQPTSSFVEQAEENSRVAFDSIHSIVQAFGSIAMMFESSFFALHSSFRAVLGVADHFSRLKHNLIETIGSNFIVRWLRNIVRRILVLIRVRNPNGVEEIWSEVKNVAMGNKTGGNRGSWPLLLFFGVVLGTPWLIWKFLSSFSQEHKQHNWMTGESDHVLGEALYDFEGENDDELTFGVGDCLKIAPKQKQPRIRGWLLATIDGTTKGIVPANYIKILGLKKGKKKEQNIDNDQHSSSLNNEENGDRITDRTMTDFEKEFETEFTVNLDKEREKSE